MVTFNLWPLDFEGMMPLDTQYHLHCYKTVSNRLQKHLFWVVVWSHRSVQILQGLTLSLDILDSDITWNLMSNCVDG